MRMAYEYWIAGKYLTRRKKTGFISLITLISVVGVAVGVMALIVVLAVMSGFDRELKQKIVGMNPHIYLEGPGGVDRPEEVVERIKAMGLPEIRSVARVVQGQAIIRSEVNAVGVVVKGVDRENGELEDLRANLVSGSFDFSSVAVSGADVPLPGLLIGKELAGILQVAVGDLVYLISPLLESPAAKAKRSLGRRAASMPFAVRGIFAMGMNDFDTQLALIGLKESQALYRLGQRASGISIRLSDVDLAEHLKFEIESRLGQPLFARSWIDLNYNFFSALKIEKAVMTILLLLIVLVAAFNIVSTLIMAVMEKTKDIGILKALGATRWSIKKIFLLEGFSVGFLGVLIGGISGLAVAKRINEIADFVERTTGLSVFPSDIYYFSKIPTEIKNSDVMLIIAFALLASVVAALYPAHKASQLNPVEALRYE